MPLYYQGGGFGYDLDRELPFYESAGVRYKLGSDNSFIIICMTCGGEAFRGEPKPEICIGDPSHGLAVPLTYKNDVEAIKIWKELGHRITSVEERRQKRLQREARGADWALAFGDKTESDFPFGYVRTTNQD